MREKIPYLLAVFLLQTLLGAQTSGTIRGTVVDEAGRPVAAAKVHIAETRQFYGSRVVRFYETDNDGKFHIEHVAWNTYAVMAGKEDKGYADLGAAFYSNLTVPFVILSPAFPTANVTVSLGPKAGVLKLASLIDVGTGHKIDQPGAVTLRRIDNPSFFITVSTTLKPIFVPPSTDVSVEITVPGYKPWPAADQAARQGKVHLKPEEVVNLDISLERENQPSKGAERPPPSTRPQ